MQAFGIVITRSALDRRVAETSIVNFIEDWQTGFFVILGSAVVGIVLGIVVGSLIGPSGFLIGFVGGGILAFLLYAYLRYGR